MKDSNYEAAEEWRGLNNYEKEVMYDVKQNILFEGQHIRRNRR